MMISPKTSLILVNIFHYCLSETVLIPRNEILGHADYTGVTMSHDGKYLAYIGPSWEDGLNGAKNIFIKELPNGTSKRLTGDCIDSISSLEIAYDGKTILYLSDPDGDENYSLNMLNIENSEIKIIEDDPDVLAMIWYKSPTRSNEVLIGINKRNPTYHDVYLLDLKTGNKTLVYQNDYYMTLLFNYDLKPLIGYNETDDAGLRFYRITENGQDQLIKKSPPESRRSTMPVAVDDTGTVYWLDNDESDKTNFVAMDPKTAQRQVLYSGKRADISDVKFHPKTGRPLWLNEDYMKSEHVPLDSSFKSDFKCLQSNISGNAIIDVSDMSLDMKVWLVNAQYDNKWPTYYYYDRLKRSVQYLFSMKESLSKYSTGSTYPFEVRTSDGLTEICYVTIPVEYDKFKNGTPSERLPTIMLVHGGPHARDEWTFSLYPQYLANRNYAVIQCNYRASTGYGKAFLNAGNGQWGLKMQEDLTVAMRWAIQQKGIADPNKLAIVGGSYGGYATLAGLAFTPDLYACGVDLVGPSNLITLIKSFPPYWLSAIKSWIVDVGGDPDTEEGREKLRKSSPLFSADKIKKPLLIGQGANDPRVNKAESDQIFEALKASNIPVTYVLFSNEGHGFNHPENNIAFWALAEKFLGDCLGGRVEPVTDEIEKSTAQIQTTSPQKFL